MSSLITLVSTNFDVKNLICEIWVFKGAESEYGISSNSSYQVYKLRHKRVLVKILTVDQFNNIEKNESSIDKSVLRANAKRFSFKILFNRIEFKKTKSKIFLYHLKQCGHVKKC